MKRFSARAVRVADDERGVTLVEVLIALIILGTAVVGLVSGFGGAIRMGIVHRSHAKAETVIRTYSENVVEQGYRACGGGVPPSYPSSDTDGYIASVTAVDYWVADSSPATFGGCSQDGSGVERVTILVEAPGSEVTETVDIFVRKGP